MKKPRIRSLADIPPLAFDEDPSATQGSNDSGASTPPDTDADDHVRCDVPVVLLIFVEVRTSLY